MWRPLLASVFASVLGIACLFWATDGLTVFTAETARRTAIAQTPRVVPAVALEDAAGKPWHDNHWHGKWWLVDFIYTRCITFCQAQGAQFSRLARTWPAVGRQVGLASVSFDPERDQARALQQYKQRSGGGAGWDLLRPLAAPDLKRLLETFQVVAIDDDMGGYVHNAAIYVIDPNGRLVRVFDWNDWRGARDFVQAHL